MNIVLSSSRRRILHFLLKPPSPIRLLSLHYEPPTPPPEKQNDGESISTQVVQYLLQTPDNDWVSSQTLHSLLFSSSVSAPSPRLFSQITLRLKSYPLGLSFFNYLHDNSQFLQHQEESLSSAFQSVLELSTREPESQNKLLELYEASKEKNVQLTANAAKLLIRFFGRAEMVEKSLLVYEDLDPAIKNTQVRNVLVDALLRDGRVDDALKVLDEMLHSESEFPPNEITGDIVFYALLRHKPKGRRLTDENIMGLVSKFGDHGVFPNSIWLTRFITRLCKHGQTDQAWDMLNKLMKLDTPLEAASCNVLLSGLGRSGDVGRMNALLTKMKELNIQPDIVTFGILINSLCKSSRVDEALEVFEKMHGGEGGNGVVIEADVITYNTLINGLCKTGRVEEGKEMMERMKSENGLAPNTATYNCLIDGFCRAGEIERAQLLYNEMEEEEGIKPNVITLNTIIGGMCRHWGVNNAVQFFRSKHKSGLQGNVVTYKILINSFCNVNNVERAMHWFNEMLKAGCCPDAMVYYALISGLCQARRADDAIMIVSKLKQAGFSLDVVRYNMLINLFCNKQKLDQVHEILTDMEESGVKPDVVIFNTLISFFSKHGDFKSAHRMLKRMVQESFIPTVVTYGALINACCLNGDIEEAMKLFRDMESRSKVMPNTVIYNILIESLCKNNELEQALSLMDDMAEKRIKPNTNTYNAMFIGLREQNRLDKVYEFMDRMVEHACVPDYITMEILTEWLSAVGETKKLKMFVQGQEVCVPRRKLGTLSV